MSLPSTSSIPLLKTGISITPYQAAAGSSSPRFLLAVGESYFLVSDKARALVLALLRKPDDNDQLEAAFEAETGQRVPAPQLLAMATQTLPSVFFADTPEPAQTMPFIVSVTLLPSSLATRVTGYLAWLFAPRLAMSLMALFAILHILILPTAMNQVHAAWSARESVQLVGLFLLSGLVHELGHTSACRYFKCPHGAIGFGLYFIFPAWYADVTKAWHLTRSQRAVVDLGGVYFQSIFLIAVDAYALATGSPLALKLAWLITFTMLFTLNPVFKFDGYWLLSDLSGLHNLHKQVRQSSAAVIAALMGKRAVTAPPVRSGILYAYSALSICYFAYFAIFLARELRRLGTSLVPDLDAGWSAASASSLEQGWQAVVAFASFGAILLWPAMILLASAFFLDKLRRSVFEIFASVQVARALVPAAKSTVENI